ncbi:ERV-BabFcenv provirus ancestral Env polyprotein-like [Lemur catta]|uniref:ERV-BabFcenv provirus ancestral Env polyprotein-like n=1 Tax=Lemur catta TaxID=9447 RepID=UPI001E267D7E|nr:ERV-BabFcenv provirus ancestral Env polyprotein-like [Lemur catta]
MVVPQLTLYGESEFGWLLMRPRSKRAIFLLLMVGLSVVSSIAASGLAGGALGHSVISAQDFADRLQLSLETRSASLDSLQRQLTSLAHVALQNQRALDLLTPEKGGTCIFLHEECYYYINESGLMEQNINKLDTLSEELHNRHGQISPTPPAGIIQSDSKPDASSSLLSSSSHPPPADSGPKPLLRPSKAGSSQKDRGSLVSLKGRNVRLVAGTPPSLMEKRRSPSYPSIPTPKLKQIPHSSHLHLLAEAARIPQS